MSTRSRARACKQTLRARPRTLSDACALTRTRILAYAGKHSRARAPARQLAGGVPVGSWLLRAARRPAKDGALQRPHRDHRPRAPQCQRQGLHRPGARDPMLTVPRRRAARSHVLQGSARKYDCDSTLASVQRAARSESQISLTPIRCRSRSERGRNFWSRRRTCTSTPSASWSTSSRADCAASPTRKAPRPDWPTTPSGGGTAGRIRSSGSSSTSSGSRSR